MKRRNWIILAIILIALATRNNDFSQRFEFITKKINFFQKINEDEKPKVKVISLGKEDISESMTFQGLVVPQKKIPLYVGVPVVVENILVKNGSIVKKKDPLLVFSSSIKEEIERELEGVTLDLNNLNLEIRDLNSGSLKLELDNRNLEIRSLREKINALERSLSVLKFESRTLRQQADAKMKLFENDGISSVEANAAMTEANKKEAELSDQISNLDIARQKYELSILSYERLKRELNIKGSNLRSSKRKLTLTKADLEEKLKNVTEPLRSPIDGLVAEIAVEEGVPFAKGKKLISIVPEGSYMIKIDAPLFKASMIEVGDKATVIFKDGRVEKSYNGIVEKVGQGAVMSDNKNFYDKIIEVYIKLESTHGLKLGYYTSVNIQGGKTDDLLSVNSFSVLGEGGTHYVYVLENGIAKKTLVELGKESNSKVEIMNLPEGTPIIVNPFKVKDGEKVNVDN